MKHMGLKHAGPYEMLKRYIDMQTGFDYKYQQRREHARATWFPSNEQEMQRSAALICTSFEVFHWVFGHIYKEGKRSGEVSCRMYEKTGMILRFAIGEVPAEHSAAVQQEEKEHGSFLRIPIEQVPLYTDVHARSDTRHNPSCCCCMKQGEQVFERIPAVVMQLLTCAEGAARRA